MLFKMGIIHNVVHLCVCMSHGRCVFVDAALTVDVAIYNNDNNVGFDLRKHSKIVNDDLSVNKNNNKLRKKNQLEKKNLKEKKNQRTLK